MLTELADIMTPFPHTIDADADLKAVQQVLNAHDVRHLAIVQGDAIVGVLSARDVDVALAFESQGGGPAKTSMTAFAIGSRPAYVVDIATSLVEVLETMAVRRYGCALITRRGTLAGIVTTTDVCRLLAEHLSESA